MKRRNHYKFTEKKHSKRGVLACCLAVASIFALLYSVYRSFGERGNGSVYLGSAGLLALVVAIVAFFQAVKSLKEEDTFRNVPVCSMVLSTIASGTWIALYVVGFLV